MNKKIQGLSIKLGLGILAVMIGLSPVQAQQLSPQQEELEPFGSKLNIKDFTADLRWYNYYSIFDDEMKSNTELDFQYRNIHMLDPHFGIGYQAQATVYMTGFFEGAGVGGGGAGPLMRFYLLDNKRWKPYLQAGGFVGYDLALADALGANRYQGVRYRTSLRAGLIYRVSNALGIFIEIGPTWEYDDSFTLDSRAILFEIGIVLFRF